MKISAVVATYNREKYLPKALESLKTQTLDKSLYEIIIVNNNSTDRTEEISENFKAANPELKIKYVIETNQGLSFGRNRGIEESDGELVTFIDDDAYLANDFLEVCIRYFDQVPNLAAIGGQILLDYEAEPPVWVTKYLTSLFGYFSMGQKPMVFKGGKYPRGSNMTFKKSVFEKYGMFNTRLGRVGRNMAGGEEKEIYDRIIKGKELIYYTPDAIVYHSVPEFRTTKQFVRNQAYGVGYSERIRTHSSRISRIGRILNELVLWGVSFLIALVYLLRLQPQKAYMILYFRYYVTKGLIFKHSI